MSSGKRQTRDRILAETWRLMEERRGVGVRLEDVAQAAGISRQALYLHYPSRADLLVATVRYADHTRGITERLVPYHSAVGGLAMLDTWIACWGGYIPEIYGLAKALLVARETDEAAAAAWEDRMVLVRGACRRVVAALVADGLLAPAWEPERASDFLWSLLSIALWEQLTIECGWTNEQYLQWLPIAGRRALVRDETPGREGSA